MNTTAIILAFDVVSILVCLLAFLSAVFQWKESKNTLDVGVMILVGVLTSSIVAQIITSVYQNYLGDEAILPSLGYMGLIDLFQLLTGFVYAWFIFYLMDWKRMYSIPLVSSYFSGLLLGMYDIDLPFRIFTGAAVVVGSLVLLYNSIKNKHALSLALAICGILFVVNVLLRSFGILYARVIAQNLGVMSIILAENGWIDEHIFFDKVERNKVRNVWIAKRIGN